LRKPPLSDREKLRRRRRSAHNAHLKTTYGISMDEYELILAAQGGKCAICRGGTSKRHFAVDHNHRTGEVRGLLCGRCNSGLARFMDNRTNLWRAHRYLKQGAEVVRAILQRDEDSSGSGGIPR
jgi:hypothetical protein